MVVVSPSLNTDQTSGIPGRIAMIVSSAWTCNALPIVVPFWPDQA